MPIDKTANHEKIIVAAKKKCSLPSLIERVKHQCNLGWIHEKRPELDSLYSDIYLKKSRDYWTDLDQEIRNYAEQDALGISWPYCCGGDLSTGRC